MSNLHEVIGRPARLYVRFVLTTFSICRTFLLTSSLILFTIFFDQKVCLCTPIIDNSFFHFGKGNSRRMDGSVRTLGL